MTDSNRKNRVQDVVRRSQQKEETASLSPRSIRNITKEGHTIVSHPQVDIDPPRTKKRATPEIRHTKKNTDTPEDVSRDLHFVYEYKEKRSSSRTILYVSIICLAVILYFSISALFKKALITFTPKNQTIELSSTFSARKNGVGNELGFQFVTLSKEVQKEVFATTSERVEKKAEGVVVLFNNTKTNQRLVENTRLESNNGLMFRLKNAVTIPASKVQANTKESVPGSVEVAVVADKVGSEYNISFSDFTIPGFKGTSKYTDIYARSKNIFSGGFSGMQKVISPSERAALEAELDTMLKTGLQQDLAAQIPKDFVLYTESITYNTSPATQEQASDDKVFLTKKGVANAVIFDIGVLSRTLVQHALPQFVDDTITIPNIRDLSFVYATSTLATITDLKNMTTIAISLSGKPYFVWSVDMDVLKNTILGLSKSEAEKVILDTPAVSTATIKTYPFWNKTIPLNEKKVIIENSLDL